MTQKLNILVTGPFGAGKSQFIETISEIPVVSTEQKITDILEGAEKSLTTVAMDYGRVTIGGDVLHLRGTPGQERFGFMRELLAREVDGFVLLLDSAKPEHVPLALSLLDGLEDLRDKPHVVVANKQDLESAVHVDQIREQLAFDDQTLVLPCIATRRSSVRQVLIQLMYQVEQE
ncbi:MAG: GTPase [Anaerolineales bacterium]|nr:GTPase [Anaerolineales bacterium]